MNAVQSALSGALVSLLLGGCASMTTPPLQTVPHQKTTHGGDTAEGQYAVGKYYLGQRRFGPAIAAFNRALELDPRHADARNGRATVLAQTGELNVAAEELAVALTHQPESVPLLNNLGYLNLLRGRLHEAADSLARALKLDPANATARANWTSLVAAAADDPVLSKRLGERSATGGRTTRSRPVPSAGGTQALLRAVTLDTVTQPATTAVLNLTKRPVPTSVSQPQRAGGSDSLAVVSIPRFAPRPARTTVTGTFVTVIAAADGRSRLPDAASAAPMPSQRARVGVLNLPANESAALIPAADLQQSPFGAPGPRPRLEVSNGNGVRGMAAQVAQRLMSRGVPVARITNADRFSVQHSRIYVRKGYREQALGVARALGVQPQMVHESELATHLDLRVVLGHDAPASLAALDKGSHALAALWTPDSAR